MSRSAAFCKSEHLWQELSGAEFKVPTISQIILQSFWEIFLQERSALNNQGEWASLKINKF